MDPNSQNPQGESAQQTNPVQAVAPATIPVQEKPVVPEVAPVMVAPPVPVVPPVQTDIPQDNQKKGSPLMIVAIILVVVAVIALALFVFGGRFISPKPISTPIVTIAPTVIPTATPSLETPVASASSVPTPTTGEIPADLVAVVKQNAADQSSPKVTVDKVIIGQSQIEGNYASVAFNYTDGGGAIFWLVKTGEIWKVVTTGQEPPKCSLLKSYNFPVSFSCNP